MAASCESRVNILNYRSKRRSKVIITLDIFNYCKKGLNYVTFGDRKVSEWVTIIHDYRFYSVKIVNKYLIHLLFYNYNITTRIKLIIIVHFENRSDNVTTALLIGRG